MATFNDANLYFQGITRDGSRKGVVRHAEMQDISLLEEGPGLANPLPVSFRTKAKANPVGMQIWGEGGELPEIRILGHMNDRRIHKAAGPIACQMTLEWIGLVVLFSLATLCTWTLPRFLGWYTALGTQALIFVALSCPPLLESQASKRRGVNGNRVMRLVKFVLGSEHLLGLAIGTLIAFVLSAEAMAVYLKQVHLPHLPLHSLALSSSLSLCHSYIKEALAPLLIQLEALCSHSATRFGIALYLYVFILLSCTNVGDKIVEWESAAFRCITSRFSSKRKTVSRSQYYSGFDDMGMSVDVV